ELKYKNYDYRGAIKSFFNLVMAYPQSEYTAKAYYEIGDSYYKLRDYRKALSNYVMVIENFPEYPETPIALYRVAVYHESRGFMDDAVKYLKILAEKYPLSPEAPRAYMKIASFLFDAKNSKEGMAWYEQAIARYPESEFVDLAWYSLGLLNFNQGVFNNSKYLDAEKYLVKFENGFASSIYREKAMELLIEVYRKTGDFKKLDQLSVFFAVQYPKSKKSVEILFNLAVDFYEKKNYDKASEYSRGLLDNPQLETEKMRRIAQLYIDIHKSHLKDGKKLFSGYKAFFNTMPGDEEALPLLGEFAVIALNNDEQDIALLAFRRLSEITRDPEEKCRASFQSAELLIKQNRPEEALSYYQIVADEFPDSDQADLALFSMATIFETGGSAFRAEIMYEKLVKNYPSRLSSARADLILAGQEVKNNELESAIRRLYRVAVTFPRFDEGRKAKEMLNKLK
ncbi:MAG TPA: hypothetical protein DC049_10880, partial [Spirochaetia bacterium]|nr:hypothetical protein [Spirochaetia bacterium]